MSIRSVIAVLLLVNYLLVVGAGCVNQPEDSHELVLMKTIEEGNQYQQCRYLRMDGLEAFLADALTNRYSKTSDKALHHTFTVVNGVDAHHLPAILLPAFAGIVRRKSLISPYKPVITSGIVRDMYTPPWLVIG